MFIGTFFRSDITNSRIGKAICVLFVCKVDSLYSMIWYLAVSYELLGVVSRPCLCVSREWQAGG